MIQCLILEDEIAAVEILKMYIEKTPFLSFLGNYESGLDIPLAKTETADVLFLDIQLPEISGLSFLKTLKNPPLIIVTSAYPNYAIEAFEEAVTDYLVKPFSYERFFKSLSRVREIVTNKEVESSKQVFLYSDKTIYKTNIEDILFLKAEVDYVNVISTKRNLLISDSLKNWEEKLMNSHFVKIHRSYIINLHKIDKISGNQVFIKEHVLPISKTYKSNFLKKLNY